MIRIVVAGLGLDGLIASWVFRQHPHTDVWLLGPNPVGGIRESESLIVDHTESVGNLCRALKVPHASFSPRDGILLRDRIHRYPDHLRALEFDDAVRVWNIYRRKAALEPCKPNGEITGRRQARKRRLRIDFDELVQQLMDGSQVIRSDRWRAEPGRLRIGSRSVKYDFMIVTDPLWQVHDRFWFTVPDVRAWPRYSALVLPRKGDVFRRWDLVLTPFTPSGAVHRVSMFGDGCLVEGSGPLRDANLLSDLNFLFRDGYELREIQPTMSGTVQPTCRTVRWPENIAPLGVFAEWRQSATIDQVLDGAYALMRRWL